MISPELLRRFSFFSGFSFDQLDELAMAAEEYYVPAGHWFFREGEALDQFFFLMEGAVALTYDIPDYAVEQPMTRQITGDMITRVVHVGKLGEHEMFGWSALIPPNTATAGAQAVKDSKVIAFSAAKLRPMLDADCGFGHLLTLRTAQTIRERLRAQRIESLIDYA